MVRTGISAGLNLRKYGRMGRSEGRSGVAALMAACTSWAAPSMSRSMSNCTMMEVEPVAEIEVISVTPAISPRRRSSGAAMEVAMISGSAPGRLAKTTTVGMSMLGRAATGRKR